MEELQKDVKYFTRLWQQELSRRKKAEAALADLVAAAEPFATVDKKRLRVPYPDPLLPLQNYKDIESVVERARKVMKEE